MKIKYNYVVIEGNIGVGKTTLAGRIADQFNAHLNLLLTILSCRNSIMTLKNILFLSNYRFWQADTNSLRKNWSPRISLSLFLLLIIIL
jgi:thymidylate kinase